MGWFKIIPTNLEWSDHLKQHIFLIRALGAKEAKGAGAILFYFDELPEPFRKYSDEWIETEKTFEELLQIANSL
jgi:hypothetical protein